MEINEAIHYAMQHAGKITYREPEMTELVARQEITGADRQWAAQYEPGNLVRYTRGSETHGIEAGEYARVEHANERENLVTVKRENGEQVSYDPRRLHGVMLYRETDRGFSQGDRVQFTAPNRERHIANRELGTIDKVDDSGNLQLRLDSGRSVAFNIKENPHLDYGYAVTATAARDKPPTGYWFTWTPSKQEKSSLNCFRLVWMVCTQFTDKTRTISARADPRGRTTIEVQFRNSPRASDQEANRQGRLLDRNL